MRQKYLTEGREGREAFDTGAFRSLRASVIREIGCLRAELGLSVPNRRTARTVMSIVEWEVRSLLIATQYEIKNPVFVRFVSLAKRVVQPLD